MRKILMTILGGLCLFYSLFALSSLLPHIDQIEGNEWGIVFGIIINLLIGITLLFFGLRKKKANV